MKPNEQLAKWVNGESIHNKERDECCPDFSCCNYAQWLEAEISKAREKIKQLEKLTDLQNEFILKGQNILPATTEE